ncbi:hypothetical protein PFISCL1PPCAC_6864, partial [Pristionchus fissidentatus]
AVTMGKLGMPAKKKKKDNTYTVDRVWDRERQDGVIKYLVSWVGYSAKNWEPLENFNEESKELCRELDQILDDPANNPKPQYLLDFEEDKRRGVDVMKRTPRPKPPVKLETLRAASLVPEGAASASRLQRENSEDPRRSGRGRPIETVNYSDIVRRRSRGVRGEEREPTPVTTPTRALPRRAAAAGAAAVIAAEMTPATTPPRSAESSRNSTRPSDTDRAESEEASAADPRLGASAASPPSAPKEADKEEAPSSASSTEPADEVKEEIAVDVRNEMRVPLVITPPALASPNSFPAASPASTVLSASKIDATTGILVPIESEFVPFDWPAYLEGTQSEAAPIECFWKRRIERFRNPFGAHITEILKVPDNDEPFNNEWCTVGQVLAVHGPWVQIVALDTDAALAQWYMADDTGLQPFVNLSDMVPPKCKEPNKRRSTGNYKKIVEKMMFTDGTDKRVPKECFDQLPWKNRPVLNHFKLGQKMETYDPVRGEGCFYPATVVELITARDSIKFHFDGYPESHTKIVPFNDYRLFPCGFAASIGWKCKLPEATTKKPENRGRKKTSTMFAPPSFSPSGQPSPVQKSASTSSAPSTSLLPQPPNNNNEKHLLSMRKGDPIRMRPQQSYKEKSTSPEEEDEEEEEEEEVNRYHQPPHRQRAPAIPGLQKRDEAGGGGIRAGGGTIGTGGVKRPAEPARVEERREEPPAKKPARQLSPLTLEEFSGQSTSRDAQANSALPPTAVRLMHAGNKVTLFLNHECSVGVNIQPACFKRIQSKMAGSLPHVWREILQQLVNASIEPKQLIAAFPKYVFSTEPHMSITYDDTVTELVSSYICAPANQHQARKWMHNILKMAGMCKNSVTFDARRICDECKNRESEFRVLDILRQAREDSRQVGRPPAAPLHPHNAQAVQQIRQQQLLQLQQQRMAQQAQQQPPVARVAPSGMNVPPPVAPVTTPLPPPPRLQQIPAAAPAAPAAAGAAPIDDPGRFLNQRVSLKALAEHEILECLAALKVPADVCDIFRRHKISYRSLPVLGEEVMVMNMGIPRQWAKVVAKFIRENQE